MNIKDLDLNLLRLFDAVWRTRSVSRAAETLDLSQPAASQGLARLRRLAGRCAVRALRRRGGSHAAR
jgi:DNA-binding transcriptional LysR family regulator